VRDVIALVSLLCAAACGASAPPAPTAAEKKAIAKKTEGSLALTVRVRGLRSNDGEVLAALFASERGFPGEASHAARASRRRVTNGSVEIEFRDLARGTYAVSVLHDENASGTLDTGFLGIPSEGLGASNGAQGRFGPAEFDDAKFDLQRNREIEIGVRYFP
jgi:uncharacterized protein (DUF2141 family)